MTLNDILAQKNIFFLDLHNLHILHTNMSFLHPIEAIYAIFSQNHVQVVQSVQA